VIVTQAEARNLSPVANLLTSRVERHRFRALVAACGQLVSLSASEVSVTRSLLVWRSQKRSDFREATAHGPRGPPAPASLVVSDAHCRLFGDNPCPTNDVESPGVCASIGTPSSFARHTSVGA
jgi:hypothetical protein